MHSFVSACSSIQTFSISCLFYARLLPSLSFSVQRVQELNCGVRSYQELFDDRSINFVDKFVFWLSVVTRNSANVAALRFVSFRFVSGGSSAKPWSHLIKFYERLTINFLLFFFFSEEYPSLPGNLREEVKLGVRDNETLKIYYEISITIPSFFPRFPFVPRLEFQFVGLQIPPSLVLTYVVSQSCCSLDRNTLEASAIPNDQKKKKKKYTHAIAFRHCRRRGRNTLSLS